jgi:drug/metabolite transporter (DMT)-like permease
MRLTTLRADLLLLAAAVIWGSGFVAQRLGSEHLDAFEYNGLRFTLGTLLLLPMLRFAPWPAHASRADARRATVRGGVLAGCAMVLAANAQQHGLGSTTASNGAFITSLYVVFVPFIALFASRTRLGWPVWCGVALAGAGLVLMGVDRDFRVNPGDAWVLLCAMLWAFHVVIVGRFSRDAEPVRFSLIQLGMTGVAALAVALVRGEMDLAAIGAAKWAVLYGAAFPVAAAFTLQTIAQKHAPPTHTALILSLESVFGMVSGMVFLHERPDMRKYAGASLMLGGVVVSQAVKTREQRERERADEAASKSASGAASGAASGTTSRGPSA